MKTKHQIIPLRVPKDLKEKIEEIAKASGLSHADIMRMSMVEGLDTVEAMFQRTKRKAT